VTRLVEHTIQRHGMKPDKIEAGVRLILEGIGEDPTREGLVDTPARVARAYAELCGGYGADIDAILARQFEEPYDEMVIVKDIKVVSLCEHHMLPFIGKAHVGYVPQGKVLGLSKLARLVNVFSRRLQVQERMTNQIADALMKLEPKGVAVVVEAEHLCMMARGAKEAAAVTITSKLTGCFKEPGNEARSEFLRLAGY